MIPRQEQERLRERQKRLVDKAIELIGEAFPDLNDYGTDRHEECQNLR
jgi:hypothetical protein